jgi:hypothetical protein
MKTSSPNTFFLFTSNFESIAFAGHDCSEKKVNPTANELEYN